MEDSMECNIQNLLYIPIISVQSFRGMLCKLQTKFWKNFLS
jgi:hypothetical protein